MFNDTSIENIKALISKGNNLLRNNQEDEAIAVFKEIILTPDAMQQFEGCYMRGADPIKIYETDGMLHYQQQGQNSFLLTPMGPRSFFIKQFNDTRVDFEVNQSGVVIGFILSDNGQKTKARKVN